jgi:hypothetical protein
VADIYTPFHDALRSAIATAWPEVVANGVYLDVQLAHIPFEKKAEAGQLPLAYIEYNLRADLQWGLANRAETGPCSVYYICKDSTLVESGVLGTKLEALRAQIVNSDLGAVAQVLTNPSCSVSANLPPNRYFANAQRPYWAGAVTFTVLIGEEE